MRTLLDNPINGLWIGWAILWAVASYDVKPDRRRESFLSRAAHVVPLWIAAVLLAAPRLPGGFLQMPLWPQTELTRDLGSALVALGLAFACWARFDLGRNWSGSVTLKQQHELIRTGPYQIVRHPIYAGLLLALIGSAIARAELRGAGALAIAFVALWRKLHLEERWMAETFGDEYLAYRRSVSALIPWLL